MAPIAARYRLVLGWIILVDARRQDAARFIEVEAEEEGHRVPVHGRPVVDSVDGGFESVVGESHEVVADVDHDGVLDGRRLDPLSVFGQYLQAADHVLPEECETLQVGVAAQPDIFTRSHLFGRHGGIEIEYAIAAWISCHAVEVVLWQV